MTAKKENKKIKKEEKLEDLKKKLYDLRKRYAKFRHDLAINKEKNTSKVVFLRKEIARLLTKINSFKEG